MDNLKATSPSPETLMFLGLPYAMLSGSLRPMALQTTSLDMAARENLIEDCSEGLFKMVEKAPQSTAKQIQADLQTQDATV